MDNNKAILIKVLTQCLFNKRHFDFITLNKFIETIQCNSIKIVEIIHNIDDLNYQSVYVALNGKDGKLLSISFTKENEIMLTQLCQCRHYIINDSYNMQYDEIKDLLLNDK